MTYPQLRRTDTHAHLIDCPAFSREGGTQTGNQRAVLGLTPPEAT